jgi:hypothetical protein
MDLKQLMMNPTNIAIVIAAALVVAALAWLYARRRRTTSAGLRRRFGPEYEQTVREQGSARKAEAQLADRQKRVATLEIRDLDPAERERFSGQWHALQSRFVDDPQGAVTDADALVSSLMQTRGYPVADFNQRAADISVDHPQVVANYRAAHEVALRLAKGEANTEDLRTATIHYRSLFEDLVLAPSVLVRKEVA